MQTIILLVLIPSLLLITVSMGALIYNNLHDIIMKDGFDRKLVAISTVFASLVNGDDHNRIVLEREIKGLAPGEKKNTLFGVDEATGYLVEIHTDQASPPDDGGPDAKFVGQSWTPGVGLGWANDIGPIGFNVKRDLAYDPTRHLLYAVDNSGRFLRIDPATGLGAAVGRTDPSLYGLAFDPKTGTLWGSGSYLARINPANGAATKIGDTGFKSVYGLAADPQSGSLYGVDADSGQILALDTKTGRGSPVSKIVPAKGDEAETQRPLRVRALAFGSDGLYGATDGTIKKDPAYEGDPTVKQTVQADRLTKIDLKTGSASLSPYVIGYRSEPSPLYQQYVRPMRKVRIKLNVTYIYTQIPAEGKWIQYVLDETPAISKNAPPGASDHSPIGTPDIMTDADAQGVKDVMEHHAVYLSDIQAWDKWGILKSAYIPIYSYENPDKVVGMTGTDINVGIIRVKTSTALAKVGIAALAALLIGTLISYVIARRLTQPIAEVKEVAIQVASGQYGHKIDVKEPKELADLATAFNMMSETLEENVREMTAANRSLEQRRRKQELFRALSGLTEDNYSQEPERLAYAWLGGANDPRDASGFVVSQDGSRLLAWIGEPSDDPLQTVKTRSDISVVAEKLLNRRPDWDALQSSLKEMYVDTVRCFVYMDARGGRVHAIARRPAPALLLDSDGTTKSLDLQASSEIRLAEGEAFLLTSAIDNGREIQLIASRTSATVESFRSADHLLTDLRASWANGNEENSPFRDENSFVAVLSKRV
jgi:HAMP domain-containing protein